jgi:hypothetical protein
MKGRYAWSINIIAYNIWMVNVVTSKQNALTLLWYVMSIEGFALLRELRPVPLIELLMILISVSAIIMDVKLSMYLTAPARRNAEGDKTHSNITVNYLKINGMPYTGLKADL